MGHLTNKQKLDFFKGILSEAGIADLETVYKIYYGLIKYTIAELQRSGLVWFPDFGKFTLSLRKNSRAIESYVNGSERLHGHGQHARINFKPPPRLKRYLYSRMTEEQIAKVTAESEASGAKASLKYQEQKAKGNRPTHKELLAKAMKEAQPNT